MQTWWPIGHRSAAAVIALTGIDHPCVPKGTPRDSHAACGFAFLVKGMRRLGCLLVLLAWALVAAPAADAAALVGTKAQLKRAMRAAGPASGALVTDLSTGRELFEWNADVTRVPASVNKLYTTAAALIRFGSAGRLQTEAAASVEPDPAGVVDGDVFLHGGGDPTFKRIDLRRLAESIAAHGVVEVTGDVLGDESLFDTRRGVPSSRWQPSRYVGILSALVLDLNLTPHRRFVHSPARTAASAFREELRRAGVKVRGRVGSGSAPADAAVLAEADSPAMAVLAQATNRPSSNFYAEQLLKALGALHGTAGTTPAGAQVVRTTVGEFGIRPQVVDGSGLSRSNRTSPREVVRLLAGMAESEEFTAFDSSLAVAGRNGTLRKRMRSGPAADRCHAKTGSLHSVSALAGYCRAADGRQLAFAILMNGVSPSGARVLQDRMAQTLAAAEL